MKNKPRKGVGEQEIDALKDEPVVKKFIYKMRPHARLIVSNLKGVFYIVWRDELRKKLVFEEYNKQKVKEFFIAQA